MALKHMGFAAALLATTMLGVARPALADGTVKVGVLQSLSGTMAISEVPLEDSELLAIDQINAAGGVLGKQIVPVQEDGASDPSTFAQKATKLIEEDKVVTVFGGWTSSSRKAMLPVFQRLHNLLWYPVQFEGCLLYTSIRPAAPQLPQLDRSAELPVLRLRQRRHRLRPRDRQPDRAILVPHQARAQNHRPPSTLLRVSRIWRRRRLPCPPRRVPRTATAGEPTGLTGRRTGSPRALTPRAITKLTPDPPYCSLCMRCV